MLSLTRKGDMIMKNKRLLSFLLCFVLIFPSVLSCLPSDAVYAQSVELLDEDFENAMKLLTDIFPSIPLGDGEAISRADFIAAVTMLLGKEETTGVNTGFTDVAPDHKYSGNIKFAKDAGLISNVDIFKPDTPITYAQALKILMCATGHGQKAEFLGGFPGGYYKVAKEAGIGEYINLPNEANISHSDAAMLLFETACADILDMTSFGSDFEYAETEGKNIFSVYHKIYITEGIVNANRSTGLYSTSSNMTSIGISLNGKEYYGEGYNSLLGKNSRVFFSGQKKREIIAAYPIGNKILSYDQDDDIKLSSSSVTISEKDSVKEEKYGLDSNFTVIYNGKYLAASFDTYNTLVNPDAGMIDFIDNTGDGKIDVIIIKSIEYGVVDAVNTIEGKIYDKFKPNAMKVITEDMDCSIIGSDGETLQLSDLTQNTVVGYIESKDGKSLEIIKLTGKMGGTYKELSNNSVLVLGKDKEVTLSRYFIENIKTLNDVKIGTQIVTYLGVGNQVVYIEEYSSSVSYGYLVNFARESGSGLNSLPCARIFTEEGDVIDLNLAEKLVYNGIPVSRAIATDYMETLLGKDNTLKVMKYAVNANGELSKVYEAIRNTEGVATILGSVNTESRPVLFDDNTGHGSSLYSGLLYFVYGFFYPYFALKTGATVMQVPLSAGNRDNMDYYNIYSSSSLSSWTESNVKTINAYGYDVTKSGASFVLWTRDGSGSSSVGQTTPSGIVETITDGVNDDGEAVKIVKLYISGKWLKLYSPANYKAEQAALQTSINNLMPGDIARISYDDKNTITALQIDFSYVNGKQVYSSTNTGHSGYGGREVGYGVGYVYSVDNSKAILVRNKTIDEIHNETVDGTLAFNNIYPVNLSSGTTVYVEFKKDRDTGTIIGADVYKEPNNNGVESYFSAGADADYIVARSRFHAPNLNVVYVN